MKRLKKRKLGTEINQHWTQKGGRHVPKKVFNTLEDCLIFMHDKGINQNIYHPYICRDCGNWHIGHYRNLK